MQLASRRLSIRIDRHNRMQNKMAAGSAYLVVRDMPVGKGCRRRLAAVQTRTKSAKFSRTLVRRSMDSRPEKIGVPSMGKSNGEKIKDTN